MKLKTLAILLLFFAVSYSEDMPEYDIYSLENTKNNVMRVRKNFENLSINKQDKGADLNPYGFYHDRGDPSVYDFTTSTADYTWRDMDLSSIVPIGTKAVCLGVAALGSTTGNVIDFRKNGNTNTINVSRITCQSQTANVTFTADVTVSVDSNRIIEWRVDSGFASGNVKFVVKGWWE